MYISHCEGLMQYIWSSGKEVKHVLLCDSKQAYSLRCGIKETICHTTFTMYSNEIFEK